MNLTPQTKILAYVCTGLAAGFFFLALASLFLNSWVGVSAFIVGSIFGFYRVVFYGVNKSEYA